MTNTLPTFTVPTASAAVALNDLRVAADNLVHAAALVEGTARRVREAVTIGMRPEEISGSAVADFIAADAVYRAALTGASAHTYGLDDRDGLIWQAARGRGYFVAAED